MNKKDLAKMIDQTLLSPLATNKQVSDFCTEAAGYGFASVCINPVHIGCAAKVLDGTGIKVCTVIDFPLGAGGLESKVLQARHCVEKGARELDFVIDMSLVKSHDWEVLSSQLKKIQEGVDSFNSDVTTKLILETCVLEDSEIVESCKCALYAGFGFVKTSTGFYIAKDSQGRLLKNGATAHAVEIMRKTVGDRMGVKASGGVHDTKQALDLINAGASRIGASAGVAIVEGLEE